MLWTAGAFAAAMVADLEGDVRVEVAGAKSRALIPGQRLDSGSLIATAEGARVTLRFDDGQWAALHERTRFRIEDYRYLPSEPAADRAAFELLRGALRIITGVIGRRNPEALELRTPSVNIGVRGTDFLVAVENPTYLSVLEGRVVAINAAGSVTFAAGDLGVAADGSTLAGTVQASALPTSVASTFRRLGAQRLAPPASPDAAGKAGRAEDAPVHRLKDGVGRDHGRDVSGAARERARDSAPRSK